MTLMEYIEKREEVLENQLTKAMEQENINTINVMMINQAMSELTRLKVAIEDGVIE